jgi:hypothetical protein
VLASGCPVTLVPLDLTFQAIATRARVAALAAIAPPVGPAVAGMLRYYGDAATPFGMAGGALHDACVIAYLLRPDLFGGRPARVTVGDRRHGTDRRHRRGSPAGHGGDAELLRARAARCRRLLRAADRATGPPRGRAIEWRPDPKGRAREPWRAIRDTTSCSSRSASAR